MSEQQTELFPLTFEIGNYVENIGSDYEFSGVIVAKFKKVGGQERYVVENPQRILHIFSAKNIRISRL